MKTAYIWQRNPFNQVAATNTPEPPEDRGIKGLTSDWTLLGTIEGRAYSFDQRYFIERAGGSVGVSDLVLAGEVQPPMNERPAVIQFQLPMAKKSSYVRAAQAEGKKLVPWMLEQLDAAVKHG